MLETLRPGRGWLLTFHLVGAVMWMGGFMVFARMLRYHAAGPGPVGALGESFGALALCTLLMLFPASEAVVAVINRLISESARPEALPRLALADGIPAEHRVLVAVPAMLTSEATEGRPVSTTKWATSRYRASRSS